MQYLTLAGLAICALGNLLILIGIHRRLAQHREMNARHLNDYQEILDQMRQLNQKDKQIHEEQMKSNAALMQRWGEVLEAYRRISFWQSR